jgi:chitodextrinase
MRSLTGWLAALLAAALLVGCSGEGGSGGGNPPPGGSTPRSLSAEAVDGTSVQLSWTGGSAFTLYRIYRNDVEIGTSTSTSFRDSGLSPSTAYWYFVRGDTSSGLSGASNTVSVATQVLLNFSLANLLDPASRSYISVRDVAFDSAGAVYLTGAAYSANFPTTAGAYDRTFATGGSSLGSIGPADAFVMKFNRAGQLQWSTLLGGPNHDRAYAIEIAPDGGIVIAGRAGEGFPTTAGVVQPAFRGDNDVNPLYGRQDGFVAKISSTGASLLWSTYIGDAGSGFLRDVGVDSANKIYVAGPYGAGFSFITGNAAQPALRGTVDLGYVRLNATASVVEYGTYLGGNEPSGAPPGTPSLLVSPSREVFVAIQEGGSGAPTTSGAYRRSPSGGVDLLIAKFNANDTLTYATYLGGAGDEEVETHNIALDSAGQLAISAGTSSRDYPTSTNAFQTVFGGGSTDAAISILSANGSSLVASTYLGGNGAEGAQGIHFAPNGLLYVGVNSRSSVLRTTTNAYRRNSSGVEDAVLAGLTSDLRGAPYLSFLGGGDTDVVRALDIAPDGFIALGGTTASSNFPISGGGSTAPNGTETGWWALFRP